MSRAPGALNASSRRANGLVRVPASWLSAVRDLYDQDGGAVYVPWTDLPYAKPKSRIHAGLQKLYPSGMLKLKVAIGGLDGADGMASSPRPGGSFKVRFAPGLKRPDPVIHHELRHVVQYVGDLALAATRPIGEGKDGRFGRPRPATTRMLRQWKAEAKASAVASGVPADPASWYYRSPSEYQPHVGNAVADVLKKLPAAPTNAQVRARIRYVVQTRPIFQHLTSAERKDALRSLYAEVMSGLARR